MNIRKKGVIITIVAFMCILLILNITASEIIQHNFNDLESEEVIDNLEIAKELISSQSETLAVTASDWGQWDDTYNFVNNGSDSYIEENMYVDAIANLQIDAMLFYGLNGNLYYAIGVDPDTYTEKEISTDLLNSIISSKKLFSNSSQLSYTNGLIDTPDGLALIASNPITKSLDVDSVAGTIVVVKYLDDPVIKEMRKKSKLYLTFEDFNYNIETSNPVTFVNASTIIGTAVLKDINDNEIELLNVIMPRDMYQRGTSVGKSIMYITTILGLICYSLITFYVDREFFSRMLALNNNLKVISKDGSRSLRVDISGHDELNELAYNINTMLDSMDIKNKEIEVIELENKERFRKVFLNTICGVIIIDAKSHTIVDVNPTAAKIIGLSREEIIGNICHKFICPNEIGKCPITDLGLVVDHSEKVIFNQVGKTVPILKSVVPVRISGYDFLIESFVDLTDIKNTEEELIQSRIIAETANRAKSDFLATMSHELRTPLNAIIGFSEIVSNGGVGEVNDAQVKYLTYVRDSGNHLLSLINNILDISKIEAGKLELHFEIVSINGLFSEIENLIQSLAIKKSIQIGFVCNDEIRIYADRIRLKQIMFNLLSNAIKFSPEKETIYVRAETISDKVRISVKDNGIGISEENKSKIFVPFTQVDSATNRKYNGTGLGLSLVKRFVEIHGGHIWFESELGKGSTFFFELPVDPR